MRSFTESLQSAGISRALACASLAVASAIVGGCGSACEEAVETLCEKACECGDCGLASAGEASIILFFSDQADCEAAANCDASEATDAELEACGADARSAECQGGAVVVPDSCGESD